MPKLRGILDRDWKQDWDKIGNVSCLSYYGDFKIPSVEEKTYFLKIYESVEVNPKIMSSDIHFQVNSVLNAHLFYSCFFFLPAPHGMQDLSSLTRDQTCTPCSGTAGF